jgi:ABC-type transport system involved in cytochrome c biogenesis permease subunit
MGSTVLGLVALLCYGGAEAAAIAHLRWDRPRLGKATTLLLAVAFALHFVALQMRARALHSVPYRDLPDSMSLFAWMLAATYGLLLAIHRERSTGPFLIPLVILFLAFSLIAPAPLRAPRRDLTGSLFAFHVTLAILAYAALTLGFVLAILYLFQSRQLQRKASGFLFPRLPALDVIDRLERTAIAVGVTALAVATVLGGVWAHRTWNRSWDPKVLWTLLTMVFYGLALVAARLGWRGRRTALLTVIGFCVLLFSYTIVNLFFSQEHMFR